MLMRISNGHAAALLVNCCLLANATNPNKYNQSSLVLGSTIRFYNLHTYYSILVCMMGGLASSYNSSTLTHSSPRDCSHMFGITKMANPTQNVQPSTIIIFNSFYRNTHYTSPDRCLKGNYTM